MAPNSLRKCPACGTDSTGKFCNSCGSALDANACGKCGAKISGRGKFCPECGASTGAGMAASSSDRTPWIIAGVAVAALVIVLAVVVSKSNTPAPTQESAALGGGGPLPDLAQMTPRDAADRLFDHVARAQSAGDTAQVAQFAPMALEAYGALGSNLDPDARLHIGLIYEAVGNRAGVAAQADTILRGSATHLYGLALRMRAAQLGNDTAAGRRVAQAFLQAYDTERAKNLPEYAMHEQLLTDAKADAQRLAGPAAR